MPKQDEGMFVREPGRFGRLPRACSHYLDHRCWRPFCCSARQKERGVVILHKRLITTLGDKMAPALRVVAKKPPLVVARRLFGVTKPRFSRLDWWLFSRNSNDPNSVNRPPSGTYTQNTRTHELSPNRENRETFSRNLDGARAKRFTTWHTSV